MNIMLCLNLIILMVQHFFLLFFILSLTEYKNQTKPKKTGTTPGISVSNWLLRLTLITILLEPLDSFFLFLVDLLLLTSFFLIVSPLCDDRVYWGAWGSVCTDGERKCQGQHSRALMFTNSLPRLHGANPTFPSFLF